MTLEDLRVIAISHGIRGKNIDLVGVLINELYRRDYKLYPNQQSRKSR
jgi:hypothetical protein